MLSVTQRNIVSLQHNLWSVLRGKSVYLYVDTLKNMSALHLDLVQQPHTHTHSRGLLLKVNLYREWCIVDVLNFEETEIVCVWEGSETVTNGFLLHSLTVYSYFLNVALWSSRMSSEHAVWCKYSLCVWAWHVCSLFGYPRWTMRYLERGGGQICFQNPQSSVCVCVSVSVGPDLRQRRCKAVQ